MSDPELAESSANKFVHPRSARDTYAAALGVVALIGLFSYLACGRSPHPGKSLTAGRVRVESVHGFGRSASAEACAPSGSPCQKLASGASVPAGSRIRTDYQTELSISVGAGHFILGRGSELQLLTSSANSARLVKGSLFGELDDKQGNFGLELPHGSLSATRAKFAAHAESDATRVEVSRGNVRVENRDGHASPVHAGEVARFSKTRFDVEPAPVLGSALAFDDDTDAARAERPTRGLGELSARKPGSREELGGAVHLVNHAVKVRIAGLMARTEIEEVFENKSGDQLEGIYRFPIPPNAQIEQLSLEVNGKWKDGAFVDRDRASAIWNGAIVHANPAARRFVDDIVWVPGPWRDPALLEWQRGGRFELRIFPIPARGERRVKLRYSEVVPALADVRRYDYPLTRPSGSEPIRQFDVDVEVRGQEPGSAVTVTGYALEKRESDANVHYAYSARDFSPSGALGVEYTLPEARSELRAYAYQPERRGTTNPPGDPSNEDAYVALALRPRLPIATETRPRSLAIVVDSSHSMVGESYARAKRLAARLVRELDADDRVTLLACDSRCRRVHDDVDPGRRGEQAAQRFLDGVQPGGASDPTRALSVAFEAAREAADRDVRVVYIGDGTPTMGPIRPSHVSAEVARALPADAARVTAVAVGAEADTETLSALARGGGGVLVRYQPGQSVGEAALAVLGASSGRALRDVEISLPDGLYAVAPSRLDSIPAGGETLVVARLRGADVSGEVTLRGRLGAENFERRYPIKLTASTASAAAFVPRLYAAQRIVELEREGSQDTKREAIDLSTRFGVASRYTSLLVLESQAMFDAFGLKEAKSVGEWSAEEVADASTAEGDDDVAAAANPPLEPEKKSAAGVLESEGLGSTGRGSGASYAAPAPAAAPAPRRARAMDEELADARDKGHASSMAKPKTEAPAFAEPARGPLAQDMPLEVRPAPPPPPRRLVPMRRIWERKAEITTTRLVPKAASFDAIAQAERRSMNEPDRREPLKKLYSLLALASDVGRAERVAQRWSERDPLDIDALTARADLAARRGDREGAIRWLGSVIDARPSDVGAQRRLERLERWSGEAALGCRHLVAAAELKQNDAKLLSDAVRCSRTHADELAARELLNGASEGVKKEVDAALQRPAPDDSVLNGDLQILARFDGSEDLDISLVDPDGQRISWLGAPTRAVIAARDVLSRDREGLSLRGAKAGEYVVEVVRARSSGPSVRGELEIRAAGGFERVPFTLTGTRTTVAVISVKMVPRLVPLPLPMNALR